MALGIFYPKIFCRVLIKGYLIKLNSIGSVVLKVKKLSIGGTNIPLSSEDLLDIMFFVFPVKFWAGLWLINSVFNFF